MTKKRILVVDDDADFLVAVCHRCESMGLIVERAHNLLSATLILQKQAPDIICTDIEMPTGSGLAFCRTLVADPLTADVPLIVLTGQKDLETKRACERLHAHYVEKSTGYWPKLEAVLCRLLGDVRPGAEPGQPGVLPDHAPACLVPPQSIANGVGTAVGSATKQILVADDDADIVSMLSQRCSALGCSVIGVHNALDALNVIHRLTPDLVCLDVTMPSGNGLSVCEMMASNDQLRKIPIIILTGRSDETVIRRCHDLLVYYVEKGADTWARVEPLVRELLHLEESMPPNLQENTMRSTPIQIEVGSAAAQDQHGLVDAVFAVLGARSAESDAGKRAGEPPSAAGDQDDVPWVLCIDDDADFSDALRIRLEQHGVAVVRAFNGMDGYRMAFTSPASAILLDFSMPNGRGDYVLNRLKDNPVTKDIPVIVITGTKDKVLERQMLSMGASAFLEKPVNFDRLRNQLASYIDILMKPAGSTAKKPPRQRVEAAR